MEPEQTEPGNKNKKILATITTLVVVALIVFGISALTKKDSAADNTAVASDSETATTLAESTETTAADTTPAPAVATPAPTETTTTPSNAYKDGTYSATGSYISPGGEESVGVTVTIKDDAITASTVTKGANDDEAEEFQNAFISGYKSLVTGKNIASLKLSRVSGSSLTSQGFNNALAQIRNKAKV